MNQRGKSRTQVHKNCKQSSKMKQRKPPVIWTSPFFLNCKFGVLQYALILIVCTISSVHSLMITKSHGKLLDIKRGNTNRQFFVHVISKQEWQRRRSPRCGSIRYLGMHMGHSHAHHDHHHSHQHDPDHSPILDEQQMQAQRQKIRIRRCALILFCAVLTLGRPILLSSSSSSTLSIWGANRGTTTTLRLITDAVRTIRMSDYIAFVLSIVSFNFFIEPISREIKYAIKRLQTLRNGLVKHAPPPTSLFSMTRLLLSSVDTTSSSSSSGMTTIETKNLAADRVTILGGFMNIILSAAKLFIGITCHSSALIADAGHSLSDLFSDFITLWAVQVGRLPPDDDHPYGHGKFEAIGALFLALTLLGTGVSVGIMSNRKLIEIITAQRAIAATISLPQLPTFPALVMAGISIVSKEWLFRVTQNVGQQINSQVVIANAWHHRSDAYSSVLALFSIGLAMAGLAAADAAAGLLVAGMICMTGAEILGESVKQLTDTSDEKLVKRITDIVVNTKDVESVERIRARQVGSSSVIDLSVYIPEHMSSVSEARAVEGRLRNRILQEEGILECDVKATSRVPDNKAVNITPVSQQQTSSIGGASTNQETGTFISKADIEANIQKEILGLYPEVRSINGVTVHYKESLSDPIDVDVDIFLNPLDDTATIASVAQLANNIRRTIEKNEKINKASIFLDLNSYPEPSIESQLDVTVPATNNSLKQ